MNAIIGYSGFVGGNLTAKTNFGLKLDSSNIDDIKDRVIDLLVVAAPSANMWIANENPEEDLKIIKGLIEKIKSAREIKRVVYMSTVAVYEKTNDVDEDHVINRDILKPYGRNRLFFEDFFVKNFEKHHILRLPGLFGKGLKKNFIYDMVNTGESPWTHQESVYQFYNLENLWQDVERVIEKEIRLININSEPLGVREVANKIFGVDFNNIIDAPPYNYNINSKYASLWGKEGDYLYNKEEILRDLKAMVRKGYLLK